MSARRQRLLAERASRREALRNHYPMIFRPDAPIAPVDGSAIVLGRDEHNEPLRIPLKARMEHMHVIGTTGGGKTKLLEHMIWQDIVDGRGVAVIDPHGGHPDSLYRALLSRLDQDGYTKTRTIHLIDPNAGTHTTGLEPLGLPTPDYDATVVAEAMQEALERLWGEEDQNTKPTLQRVLAAILTALTELGLTLAEARLLFDPSDRHGIRAWAIANLKNQEAREELEWLHEIAAEPRGRQDFRMEVTGPRNRLSKLTRVESIRTMLGQQERTLDFRAALDEGHIILANLSPGSRASDKAVQLLGRLLTRMLFFHAVRREHPERPFVFVLDECHLYLSGDVSRLLAEIRKYGVAVVLSHQTLAQTELAGLDIVDALKSTTNIKAVFRTKDPQESAELAEMVLRYDLEMPVQALVKPTVIGHRIAKLQGESVSDQIAVTEMQSETHGTSVTESYSYSQSVAETVGEAISSAESQATNAAQAASSASAVGSGTGFTATDMMTPTGDFFPSTNLVGLSESDSLQASNSQMAGSSSARGSSASSSIGTTSSRATTTASSWSEGVAHTKSSATSVGKGVTRGQAQTRGTQEAFESLYEDRPSAVHNLENIRYMAATVLRSLTTGTAAVSFVDKDGLKTAALRVANVESRALPAAQFEELRTRVFEASPSATPIETAMANIAVRERALIARATQETLPFDVEAPASFRVKKKRLLKAGA